MRPSTANEHAETLLRAIARQLAEGIETVGHFGVPPMESESDRAAEILNQQHQRERDASPDGMTAAERAVAETAKPIPLPVPTLWFIVVQLGAWGKGDTIEDAWRKCRQAGGRGKALIYATTDPAARVDDYGNIHYYGHGSCRLIGKMASGQPVPMKAKPKN